MRATLLTVAALAALLGGCREKQASGAIPRQRFVLANADLRSVPDTGAGGDSLRRAALKKHRVTEADLLRFVNVHARSPEYMAEVWREVADSVQKRFEGSMPSHRGPPPMGPGGVPDVGAPPQPLPGGPGQSVQVVPGVPPQRVQVIPPRGPDARKPPPPPDQPPPPVTEPPRPMVRGPQTPPVRRPPVDPPPDARRPMTRPGQRPLAPMDTLDRRR